MPESTLSVAATAAHRVAAVAADHAPARDLYAVFGVPDLPRLWTAFTSGELTEAAFLAALAEQSAATKAGRSMPYASPAPPG